MSYGCQVRANSVLRDSLVSKKANLAERREQLQRDVSALREQLLAQREAQVAMERGGHPGAGPPELDGEVTPHPNMKPYAQNHLNLTNPKTPKTL